MSNVTLYVGEYKIRATIVPEKDRLAIYSPYNADLLVELKSLQGRRWHKQRRCWSCDNSVRNRFALGVLAGDDRMDRYDCEVVVPESFRQPRYHTVKRRELLPWEHQVKMAAHLYQRRRAIIAGEMGTGKTLSAILAMEETPEVAEWWWVGPKSALTAVKIEFLDWDSWVRPIFMTYEGLRKRIENWEPGDAAPVGIVGDESSKVKSSGAKRSKAFLWLSCAMEDEHGDDARIWLMSGSPAPHDPTDWWHQAEVARPGYLRESNVFLLRNRIAELEEMEVTRDTVDEKTGEVVPQTTKFKKIIGWKDEEVISLGRRLDGLVVKALKKDCLDLPDKQYKKIQLPPTDSTKRVAQTLAWSCTRAIELLERLRELSDGFQYREDGKPRRGKTPKDDALREILKNHEDVGRLVVYAGFTESVNRCSGICLDEKWDLITWDGRGVTWFLHGVDKKLWPKNQEEAIRWFQDPESHPRKLAFVGHPGAAGMGLTLTASPSIVYYSNDFNAESRIQSEDRIHRAGMDTNRGATIYDLIHLATDLKVLRNLQDKRALEKLSLEEVRRAVDA